MDAGRWTGNRIADVVRYERDRDYGGLWKIVVVLALGALLALGSAATAYADGSVAFSGVAVEASGVPVGSGTFVNLVDSNGQVVASGQVALDGSFSIQAPPAVYGLRVDDGTTFDGQSSLLTLTVPGGVDLTQGSVSQNITMPAVADFEVSVIDGNSAPVQGARIDQNTDQSVSASGWPGGPVGSAGLISRGSANCTTDSSGACSIPALLGSTADQTYIVTVPSGPTLTETEPDITTDPTTTVAQVRGYLSLLSAGSSSGRFSVTSAGSTAITNGSVTSVPSGALPGGAVALIGALSYSVTGLTPGATTDVTIVLPAGSAPTAVYKQVGGQYVDLTSIATITGNTITLHITDGGVGDSDGAANGTIVDPVIPAFAVPLRNTAPPVISGFPRYLSMLRSTAGSWSIGGLAFHYQWQQCDSSGLNCTNIANATRQSYVPSSNDIGHRIQVVVSASNSLRQTAQATAMTAVIAPAVQMVRFTTRPLSPAYGGSYSVGATGGGSGNPIIFSIGAGSTPGACSLSGKTVSFILAGTCIMDAAQAGNADYQTGAGTQTILIRLAKLAVIADPQARSAGAPNSPLTAHITGFVNGQSLTDSGVTGIPHCTTTAKTTSPAGTYPISCSRGTLSAKPGTYSFTFVRSQLTIS
jgi:hypothetical protein